MAYGLRMGGVSANDAWKVPIGTTYNFGYVEKTETWVCQESGLYCLEVYGSSTTYGNGGYSKGYKYIEAGTTLYICCGSYKYYATLYGQTGYGYNGGGSSGSSNNGRNICSGGGATHIALVDGELKSIGKTSFDENGLIVAGGCGGSVSASSSGSGGGVTGGSGTYAGGSQTSGYAFGLGSPGSQGWDTPAGGGGYYGGYGLNSTQNNNGASGGGGSGWIGGVPQLVYKGVSYVPETKNGLNTTGTYGKAIITRVA